MELLTPSVLELVQKIINGVDLGGKRPSDMMDNGHDAGHTATGREGGPTVQGDIPAPLAE